LQQTIRTASGTIQIVGVGEEDLLLVQQACSKERNVRRMEREGFKFSGKMHISSKEQPDTDSTGNFVFVVGIISKLFR
jgi:hypothetical protein